MTAKPMTVFGRLTAEQPIGLWFKIVGHLVLLFEGSNVALVDCTDLEKFHSNRTKALTALGSRSCFQVTIGAGEVYKSLSCCKTLLHAFGFEGAKKNDVAIAWGGGIVGDLVGYLAASYMRGISLVHVPTTLLAQTDSSIGGKTGLNTAFGKNTVGTFHSARTVAIDVGVLRSLPLREWKAGLCEIIKVGVCTDETFFCWLESKAHEVLRHQTNTSLSLIRSACRTKAYVVARDPKEKGMRSVLNFGHTFGHAIELGMSYSKWSHGEAVGCGMAIAANVSLALGLTHLSTRTRLVRLLATSGLPVFLPTTLGIDVLVRNMGSDKKNLSQLVSVVLLRGIADPIVVSMTPHELTKATKVCSKC